MSQRFGAGRNREQRMPPARHNNNFPLFMLCGGLPGGGLQAALINGGKAPGFSRICSPAPFYFSDSAKPAPRAAAAAAIRRRGRRGSEAWARSTSAEPDWAAVQRFLEIRRRESIAEVSFALENTISLNRLSELFGLAPSRLHEYRKRLGGHGVAARAAMGRGFLRMLTS